MKPREHQVPAIKSVVEGFESASRLQIHMAPGTGKTLIAYFIHQQLKPALTIFAAPTIHLVHQSILSWCRAGVDARLMAVCSGRLSRTDEEELNELKALDVHVSTNVDDIACFSLIPGRKVIFCTYRSYQKIVCALEGTVDLLIADEAHHLAGSCDKISAIALSDESLVCDRRLFMTATPRISKHERLFSMDDENVFGKCVHTLPFLSAIEDDILTDFQLIVSAVNTNDLLKTDNRNQFLIASTMKAIEQFDLKHGLSFHSSVAKAKTFAEQLQAYTDGAMYVESLSAADGVERRDDVLTELRRSTPSLVSNVRILGEGFDFDALDFVVIADPKTSVVEIIQNIGRVMRKNENKDVGTIVVPVDINSDNKYGALIGTIRALGSIDQSFVSEIQPNTQHRITRSVTMFSPRTKIIGNNLSREEIESFMNNLSLSILELPREANDSAAKVIQWYKQHGQLPQRNGRSREEDRLAVWFRKFRYQEQIASQVDSNFRNELDEIVCLYNKVASEDALCKTHSWGMRAMRQLIKKHNVKPILTKRFGKMAVPYFDQQEIARMVEMETPSEELLTTEDIAEKGGFNVSTVRYRCRIRKIAPSKFIGAKGYYFTPEQVNRILE